MININPITTEEVQPTVWLIKELWIELGEDNSKDYRLWFEYDERDGAKTWEFFGDEPPRELTQDEAEQLESYCMKLIKQTWKDMGLTS